MARAIWFRIVAEFVGKFGRPCGFVFAFVLFNLFVARMRFERTLLELFQQVDKEIRKEGKSGKDETLEKAADTIMSCFRICGSDG